MVLQVFMAIIPFGTPAWQAGISSALFGALAAFFIALTVERWISNRPAAYVSIYVYCMNRVMTCVGYLQVVYGHLPVLHGSIAHTQKCLL